MKQRSSYSKHTCEKVYAETESIDRVNKQPSMFFNKTRFLLNEKYGSVFREKQYARDKKKLLLIP